MNTFMQKLHALNEKTRLEHEAKEAVRDKSNDKIFYPRPSKTWVRFIRFDPRLEEHRLVRYMHPERVVDSEKFGQLIRTGLEIAADEFIDNFKAKYKQLPQGVARIGEPPPDNLSLEPTERDLLAKQLLSVLDMSKQSLQSTDPAAVIQATMESLRRLQTLDGSFPKPLTEKSLHGFLGDFVSIAHPTIVASREMLLYEMLSLIGALVGDSFFLLHGANKHFSSLYTLAIGRTSDGKGAAWHCCQDALRLVDPTWMTNNVHSNPASGEALVRMLGGQLMLEGGHRKRVAIFNSEMVDCFVVQQRQGSTLSGHLRKAYDGEHLENFRSEGKKTTTADNYLLGFCGTITPAELREAMPKMDWRNGAQNRFLWSIAYKDKELARSTTKPDFRLWAERMKKLLDLNKDSSVAIEYSEAGARTWDLWFKSLPAHDDSMLADSQQRVPANCARVAVLYAQLDERRLNGWQVQIEPRHVEAAIEIVDRSRQSVQWYLAQQAGSTPKVSYADIQKLKLAYVKKVRDTGEPGLTAMEIYAVFSNKTAEQRDAICMEAGFKLSTSKKTARGKPPIVWVE